MPRRPLLLSLQQLAFLGSVMRRSILGGSLDLAGLHKLCHRRAVAA